MGHRKSSVLIGVLILALAYWAGVETREFTSTKSPSSQDRDPLQLAAKTQQSAKTQTLAQAVLNPSDTPIDFQALMSRFSSPYAEWPGFFESAHHDLSQKNEAVDRLRILRQLKVAQSKNQDPAINGKFISLYSLILKNTGESWLVQRQALKNMNPLWAQIDPKERNLLASGVDLRARAHWRKSDTELAAMIWGLDAP